MELCHASVFLAGIQAFLRFILGASKKHAGMTQFDECSQKMDHFATLRSQPQKALLATMAFVRWVKLLLDKPLD